MVKRICFTCLLIIIFLFVGCKNLIIEEIVSPLNVVPTTFQDDLQIHEIHLDYFSATRNSATIIEDIQYVYFGKKDGLYVKDKKSKEIVKVANILSPDYLQLYNDVLYFKSNEKLYRYTAIGKYQIIFEADTQEKKDAISQDYQVYKEKVFFLNASICAVFDMNTKEFKTLPKLFSVSEAEIREDKIYYIEHAERTFTLFSYDIETEEKKIIIGSGESEPDEILIKNFVFVENDLYIFQRMPQVLYQYNNGNMKIISDFCIKWMSSWNGGLLYSFDNTSTFLYFYDNDNIKIIEMVTFDTLRGLTIVDGCIYFFDGNPQVIQYNEIKS